MTQPTSGFYIVKNAILTANNSIELMRFQLLIVLLCIGISCHGQEVKTEREIRESKQFWDQINRLAMDPLSVDRLDCRRVDDLEKLFEVMPQFKNIEWLNMWGLDIDTLPDFFAHFPKLTWIELGNNQLSEIPPSFNQLAYLEDVGLYSNRLTSLPDILYQSELNSLDVSNNMLQDTFYIPFQWRRITELALGNNPIVYVEGIGNLKKVERFRLNGCCISVLADDFKSCKKLATFYIDHNPIESLPKSLLKRRKLWYILMDGTAIEDELVHKYQFKYRKKAFDVCPTC